MERGEVAELEHGIVRLELDAQRRLGLHHGLELGQREGDRRTPEAVRRVADEGGPRRHGGAGDAQRVPHGEPGAKLIAQTRTPGEASRANRWRSWRGCCATS